MENEDNSRTARILYERGNYKNVPPFQDINLLCSAIGPIDRQYSYLWRINGVIKKTQKNVVEVTLSNDYCGKQQTLNLDLQPIAINENFSTVKQVVKEEIGEGDINAVPFKFVPFCTSIMIRDFYFYDKQTKIKLSPSSVINVNYPILAVVEIAGSNGHILNGYFKVYINGRPKNTFAASLPPADKNRMVFIVWFTPYEIPVGSVAKIEVELFIFLPHQQITKKLQLNVKNDFTYNPNDIKGEVQPALVGENSIRESNYNPCRYSRIIVSFNKRDADLLTLTVFDETVNTSVVNTVALIGGKRNLKFKLLNYYVLACTLEKHRYNKAALSITNKPFICNNSKDTNIEKDSSGRYLYPISSDGSFEIVTCYQYSIDELFSYLFNPPLQKGICCVETCRYRSQIPIEIYPDIEWCVTIKLSNQDYGMSFTNMSNEYGRYQQYYKEAQKLGADRHFKKGKLLFEWSIAATYNDGETAELSGKIEKPVKKIFDAFYMVYKGLESLTGCDVAKVKARDIPVMNKAPFTLSFSSPTFFISAGWKFDYGVKNNIIQTGVVSLGFDPLIKADGKVDVLACAEKIPPYGTIVTFLEKGLELVKKTVKFVSLGHAQFEPDIACYIIAFGEVTASGEFVFSEESKEFALKSKGSVGLGFELSIKADVKFKIVTITGNKATATVGAGITGKGETSFDIVTSVGYENSNGYYIGAEISFQGITLSISGEAYIGIKDDSDDNNTLHNASIGCEKTFFKPDKPLIEGKYYFT